ncbi:MAG: carboxypeptidase M32 [Candidatus Thorarchaeota archaeon]|jgi:carboxypeptidase Taq
MEAYDELMAKMKEIIILASVYGVVQWDMETYMPPKGIMLRSEQLSQMGKMLHRMSTEPRVGELLEKIEKKSKDLSDIQNRNASIVRRDYDKETKIPEDLVARLAKQRAISIETWKKAKSANDWNMFKPELQKMVDLSRERSEIEAKVKGIPNLYDSMLDEFERGLTYSQVSKVFGEIRDRLVPLSTKCAKASKDLDTSFLSRKVPIDVQRKLAIDLSNLMGYDTISDKAGGRIDEVEHPFTTGYYDDLNPEWMYTPVGQNASFGIHEAQSRFIENMIGRSPEFLQFYLPRFNELTGGILSDIDEQTYIKAMNLVQPSLIRIEADEVTYSLHIIIRFEIERDLFSEDITVSELPQVWNEKYKEYLGIDVPDDTNGVLQDTHWASGYFGYFPSYALGNIYDGMLLERLNKDVPDWLSKVEKGDLLPSLEWMAKHVHIESALYDPADLIEKITGSKLTAEPFLNYVENKYSTIFGF